MRRINKIGKWSRIGLITGAIIGFGFAIYLRHNGYMFGKLVGLGIMIAGYYIGRIVDKRI